MKVLLMPPFFSKDEQWAEMAAIGTNSFNYGFASLAGYLNVRGHEVLIFDPSVAERSGIESRIRSGEFDLIGITTWTEFILKAYETARWVKSLAPAVKVVFGGIHATLEPERTMRECPELDYLIVGEGEKALLALADGLGGDRFDPLEVPSLYYREGGSVLSTARASLLAPEELPFPDYEGGCIQCYQANAPHYRYHPTFQIVVSRGCPYKCAFCNAYDVHGHKVRNKPVESIIEELEYLRDELGARGFSFLDSTFTAKRRWAMEFCEEYGRRIGLPWCCFSRSDRVDDELLGKMRASGCWQIGFGFEAGNDKALKAIGKGTTVAQNEQAVSLCRRHGIRVYASFILGWPGETYEDAMDTVKWALRHTPCISIFNVPKPYPGTGLYAAAREEGCVPEKLDWHLYDSIGQINKKITYVNPLIGEKRMGRLQREAYVKYYTSPRALFRLLAGMRTWPQVRALFPLSLVFVRIMAGYLRQVFAGGDKQGRGG